MSDELVKSVTDSIAFPEAHEVLGDLIEVGIDNFLAEGIARDIPIVSTVINLRNAVIGLRDMLYLKRVFRCLFEASKLTQEEREKWNNKLKSDPDEVKKVGETTLMILEQLDSMDKSGMVGQLFRAYIRGIIDHPTYLRLAAMVQRAYLSDLHAMRDTPRNLPDPTVERLASVGIMTANGLIARWPHERIRGVGHSSTHYDPNRNELDDALEKALNAKLKHMTFDYRGSPDGNLLTQLLFEPDSDGDISS